MKIETCVVGPIQTNCYIVEDNGETIVIDPGDDLTRIVADLKARPVSEIVATHCHFDHVGALSGLKEVTGAPAAMSKRDAELIEVVTSMSGVDIDRGYGMPHIDRLLHERDSVTVGDCVFEVIETPGHSEGSICLYCADEGILFAGDTLFAGGGFGRTDFRYGDMATMVETLSSKFADIPDDVTVYSGHGMPSTMARERALNPYLR